MVYVKVELFFKKLLFYFVSVNLKAWFSVFLVSSEPKYTQIDLSRQMTLLTYFQSDGNFHK